MPPSRATPPSRMLWRLLVVAALSSGAYIAPSRRPAPRPLASLSDDAALDAGAPPARRRRPRYSGSYPKRFGERYKEHAGDAATLQRVREKGGTPAGTHVPIMVRECLDAMGLDAYDDKAPLLVVDCTLGFGGHSAAILARLSRRRGAGRLLALDVDPIEMPRTEARLRAKLAAAASARGSVALKCERRNFGELGEVLRAAPSRDGARPRAHALLADLGCSSMQIDDPSRGFTYKAADAPLDMRQ